jgi:ATP-dependent protease ClpP protease subunit
MESMSDSKNLILFNNLIFLNIEMMHKGLNLNTEPDYKSYSLDELQSSYDYIDKEAYPERTKKLLQEIHSKTNKNVIPETTSEHVEQKGYLPPNGNWFRLHWLGKLPLENSYWINVFAISLSLSFLTPIIFEYFADSSAKGAVRGLVIILFYILISGIAVWQLVGLYRSADKHVSRGGSSGWAMIAKIMVLIGVARYCYDMSQTGAPFILESGKMVVGISTLPPLSIRIMNRGTEVELQGGLEFGTSEKLSQLLMNNPSVKIIHLNSLGGRIAEAKKLAEIVRINQLITYSKTQCLSACPIVFMAGKEKNLASEAKLGFHSASFGGVSGSEFSELNKALLSQLEDANVPSWFIKKVAKVNSNDLWNPTTEELIKAGIVDRVVDSGDYALSGVNDWKNPVTIDQELQKNEVYRSLHKFDKEGYGVIRGRMVAAIKDGTPLNPLTVSINNYLYVERLNHYMQLGGDDEVIQYMKSQITQMEYLQKEYPAKCASYTYPDAFDNNIANDIPSLLPSKIREDENIAFNSLIKSLSTENLIVDKEEQTLLITGVVEKIIAVDASYSDVLSNAINYKDEPEKLCTVAIMLNKEINLLPKKQAGSLLRSFFLTES